MHALKRPLALLLSAALLVVGFDAISYAATGQSLILGKSNVASSATTIKRTTGGAVLQLKAKKNSPPLATNSKTRVTNLNADFVDGLSSAELATNTITVKPTLTAAKMNPSWNLNLPNGTYLVNWQAYVDLATQGNWMCGITVGSDFVAMSGSSGDETLAFVDVLSGSGVVTFSSATTEAFFCNTGGNMEAFAGSKGIEIAFQKVASNTNVAAPVTP